MKNFVKWLTSRFDQELADAENELDPRRQELLLQRANVLEETLSKLQQEIKDSKESRTSRLRVNDPWINRMLNELGVDDE